MISVFVGTSNIGKQLEVENFAQTFGRGIKLIFPDPKRHIKIKEKGNTYLENALLKARAYSTSVNNKSMIFVGDDSGLQIPALNNQPGVRSKRWAGYEMSDEQILEYCLTKMAGLKGEQRKAIFETIIVALRKDGAYTSYSGTLRGYILEKPVKLVPLQGFPFRETFWIGEIQKTWGETVKLDIKDRGGLMTNREKAFQKLFIDLTNAKI